MKSFALHLSLLLLVLVSGCAFSNSKLDVRYDASIAKAGPLSAVDPVTFKIESLQDNRPFFDKIGDKKNGYGMDCADIVTISPVPEIVREGLTVMFQKNGHIVSDDNPRIVVTGIVETFWFESQMNFWTIEYMGTADVNLEFKDALSNTTLLSKRYSGHYNEQFYTGFDKEMQNVMNRTLEDLVNSVCMDTKLTEILQSHSSQNISSL